MRYKRSFLITVCFPFILSSAVDVWCQQNTASRDKAPKIYKGAEIKIVALDRMKEWEFAKNIKLKADEGQEMVVVKLEVKWLGEQQDFNAECSKTNLIDIEGKQYECKGLSWFVGRGLPQYPTSEIEIPFQVPIGTKLRAFEIEEVSINLENSDKTKTGN